MKNNIVVNASNYTKDVIKDLLDNKIIVFPTDTCYGIIASFSRNNQNKINEIKQRSSNYKIPVLYSNPKTLLFLTTKEMQLLENNYNQEGITYAFSEKQNAVRKIYTSNFDLKKIINVVGPILATSFNKHKGKPLVTLKEFDSIEFPEIHIMYFFSYYLPKSPSKIYMVDSLKNKIERVIR